MASYHSPQLFGNNLICLSTPSLPGTTTALLLQSKLLKMKYIQLPLPVISRPYTGVPNPPPEPIQLVPIRSEALEYETPTGTVLQKHNSMSSATDSGRSNYYQPLFNLPRHMPCASPQLGRSITGNRIRHHPYFPSSEPVFHDFCCRFCLNSGEQVLVQPEQPCVKCHTVCFNPRSTRKIITHKKRQDRHLYSKLAPRGAKPPGRRTKDQSEAGHRLDHTTLIGMHQHQLMRLNPDLPGKARIGGGRQKLGWKALGPNNICKDVAVPLTYNKEDVFISAIQVLEDSDLAIRSCRDLLQEQQQKCVNMLMHTTLMQELTSSSTLAPVLRYLQDSASLNAAHCIEASCRVRGTHEFRVPFGAGSKNHSSV